MTHEDAASIVWLQSSATQLTSTSTKLVDDSRTSQQLRCEESQDRQRQDYELNCSVAEWIWWIWSWWKLIEWRNEGGWVKSQWDVAAGRAGRRQWWEFWRIVKFSQARSNNFQRIFLLSPDLTFPLSCSCASVIFRFTHKPMTFPALSGLHSRLLRQRDAIWVNLAILIDPNDPNGKTYTKITRDESTCIHKNISFVCMDVSN